jgi:hypothetical protein
MAKNRIHTTAGKKKKDPYHCGTITAEDQMRMNRAGRREAEIASGIRVGSGSGVHGGGKRDQSRRNRRDGRQAIRQGRFDD